MAERIQFYYHEKGNHAETWHYLCVSDTGDMHVESEFSAGPGRGAGDVSKPHRRTIGEFMESGQGTPQDNLQKLLTARGDA